MALISRRVAERVGIDEAKRVASEAGRGFVEPILTDGILTSDAAAVTTVNDVVLRSVKKGDLVRVKVWRQDGTIIYSDESRLIGRRFRPGLKEDLNIANPVQAEISSLNEPENQYEASQGQLLETYLPINTPNGTPVLFEAYFRYEGVVDLGRSIWLNFAMIAIGALILLQLVQLPLAASLASSLRKSQAKREMLLQHAVEASERERGRIARDLHDGVVQDLSGVSYALAALARNADMSAANQEALGTTSSQIRDSVGSLRSLLVDIYPPNLHEEGLRTALENLVGGLTNRGVRASLEWHCDESALPRNVEALLYRGAQEAIRNIVKHAKAESVRLVVSDDHHHVILVVDDDGSGFEPSELPDAMGDGHVGLRALSDLVAEAGGTVEIASAPGRGAEVRVEVPLGP